MFYFLIYRIVLRNFYMQYQFISKKSLNHLLDLLKNIFQQDVISGTTSNYGIIEILFLFCIDKHMIYPSIKLKAARILLENPIYPSLEEFFDSLFLATHLERNPKNLILLLDQKEDIIHPLIVVTKDIKKKIVKELILKIKSVFDRVREESNYHLIKNNQPNLFNSECWFLSRWPYVIDTGNGTPFVKNKSKKNKKSKNEKRSQYRQSITRAHPIKIKKKSKSLKRNPNKLENQKHKTESKFYSQRYIKKTEDQLWDLGDLDKIDIGFQDSESKSFKFDEMNIRKIFKTMKKDCSIFKKIYKPRNIKSKLWNIERMLNCLKIRMFRIDLMPSISEYSFFQTISIESTFKGLLSRCQNCLNSLKDLVTDLQKIVNSECDKLAFLNQKAIKEGSASKDTKKSTKSQTSGNTIFLNCCRFINFQEQIWILLSTLTQLLSTMVLLLYQNPNDTFDNIKSFNLESLLTYLFGSPELEPFWSLLYHTRVKPQHLASLQSPKQMAKVIIVQIGKKSKYYIAKSEFCRPAIITLLLSISLKQIRLNNAIIKNTQFIKSKGISQQTNQLLIMGLQLLYLWQEKSKENFSVSKLESSLIYNFKQLEYPLTQKVFLMIFNSKLLKIDRFCPNLRLKTMKSLYLNVLTFSSPNVAFFETEMHTLLTQIISQDLSAHKYIREFEQLFKKKFYNEKSVSHIMQMIKNIWKMSNRHELDKMHKMAQKPIEFENQLNMLHLNRREKGYLELWIKIRLPLVF